MMKLTDYDKAARLVEDLRQTQARSDLIRSELEALGVQTSMVPPGRCSICPTRRGTV